MPRIVSLDVQQIKRITAAHIEPDGSVVIIGGRNAAGKSSVLDAIAYALGGRKLIPAEPLRHGAERGHAEVTLDDGTVIRRTFTATGGALKVTTADGLAPRGAQTWLDARIGALSFDPTAFLRQDAAEQAATLRRLCGVDTSDLDERRAGAYSRRTECGRLGKAADGAVTAAEHHPDAPEVEVSIADLVQQRRQAEDENRRRAAAVAGAAESRRRAEDAEARAAELLRRGEELRAEAKMWGDEAKDLRSEAERLQTDADAMTVHDTASIDDRIASAEAINSRVRANEERARLIEARDKLRRQYAALTDEISDIDRQRAEMLAAAEMPLDGLSIDEGGRVTYHGVPIDQASQAEQIRISLAVGAALAPDLRIMLIRDGSLLDEDNLRRIAEEADARGIQVWIERVGDSDDGAIVIEDGAVREVTR